jgi:VIT1/CCC1 family predicted Fe2+/Mn2+ transporter
MYTGLKHLHSTWAYIVLALLIISTIVFLAGWLGKKPFGKTQKKLGLFSLIAMHLQLVFGLILYFVSPVVESALAY